MEKRTTKTKKGILIAVIIACLIVLIAGTYSRYTSTGTATVNAEIAKWHVVLGGTDISTQAQTVNANFVYDANSYVKSGKLAPGRSGQFTIEVDPTGSEVAIDYTFTIDDTALASNANIAVTGATYTMGSESGTATIDANGVVSLSESLAHVQAGDTVTLTVTVAWTNGNNATDTAEGVTSYETGLETGTVLSIPVTVTASQKI